MNIVILCKGQLDLFPPVMSVASILLGLGHDVQIITSFSSKNIKEFFSDKGVDVIDVLDNFEAKNFFSKIFNWKIFSYKVWSFLKFRKKNTILWISTADTALALGNKLLQTSYILQILELYDTFPLYRNMLARYARKARCVVVPEMCRAAIFRSWYGLKTTPTVLPNKPYEHPGIRKLEVSDFFARKSFKSISSNEKIVLYQGHIEIERDVRPIGKAVQSISNGWRFAVMGPVHGNYKELLKESCPDTIFIPQVSAPLHLEVTSHAYVGVISYSWNKLNHVFCAPNKIWEYAGFGLPMICNDLPALQIGVEAKGAGLCVNIEDQRQIELALLNIDKNYEKYSRCSYQLYDSVDVRDIVWKIVKDFS